MEVPLQNLLHHTVTCLIEFLKLPKAKEENQTLCLHLKCGFDGTSTYSYKQRWKNKTGNDDHIFCSSLVPLQLIDDIRKVTIWMNPIPSSTRLCLPIRIQFTKETNDVTQAEERIIKNEINDLREIEVAGYKIKFNLSLTMVDGKVGNIKTN